MSELIKENTSESMITMARLRICTLLGLFFIASLFLSTAQQVTASESGFIPGQTLPLSVYAWGIEGEPEFGNGFDVWANVSDDDVMNDDDPGVRNVTVQVTGPNMTLYNLLTHNGTYYSGSVPAFPNDGTFSVRIHAYNMDNETRTSTEVQIVFESDPTPTVDPSVTMPIVVGSSFGFMAVIAGIALVYDRKRVSGENTNQPEYEV